MYFEELEGIGLTSREIRVYTALLEVGVSSVGAIIKKSGIPSSKIYETLDKLKRRGFVSSIIKDGKQFFEASNPQTISNYLDEQKRTIIENVIPRLDILKKKEKKKRESKMYEGISGLKSIYERMLRTLKKGDTIYVLGAPKIAQEKLEAYFLYFNKRRIQKGIKMKIIYALNAKEYGKKRERMQLTEVKYLTKEQVTPAWMDIFGDCIVIFNIEETPTGTLIQDDNNAKNFKRYFEILWNNAEKE